MRSIWKFITDAANLWGLLPATVAAYVTTTAWAIVMGAFGYLEGIPVMWIMMAIPLALAGIFSLILSASKWRERTKAVGKLRFDGILVGGDYIKDLTSGAVIGVSKIQVRLLLGSAAAFPLSYIVDELHTSFEGRTPTDIDKTKNSSVINSSTEQRFYCEGTADMTGFALKPMAEGKAKFKIRYGAKGREKYVMEKNIRFDAHFEPKIGAYLSPGYQDI